MRYLKLPLVLLAIVGLIALTGCGGDDSSSTESSSTATSTDSTTTDASAATDSTASSADPAAEEYGQGLTAALTDFGTSFQKLGSDLQGASKPAQISAGVSQLEDQLSTTIDELNALDPPAEAQDGQDQVVAAFEGLSGKLGDVGDAVGAGDPQAAKQAAQALQSAVASFQGDLQAGITEITQAGVPVGPA